MLDKKIAGMDLSSIPAVLFIINYRSSKITLMMCFCVVPEKVGVALLSLRNMSVGFFQYPLHVFILQGIEHIFSDLM